MVRCILYVCMASCCFCLFIRGFAHLDGLFTLSASLFSTSCMCFPVSFHVDWLFLHPSIFLSFSPLFSLPPRSPPSVWCVFDWEGCQPFLIGLLLHLMLADWLVWLASGDVMRSWLAACNLCMNSFDVFCIVFNWWICSLIHLLFPSFFKETIKWSWISFWMLWNIFVFFVLCANCCVVCVQNCLTTH